MVECRTRNQVSPCSNPHLLPFRRLGIFILSIDAPIDSAINEYLAINSGGNVSDLVLARNCCLARMLPGEAELVSEWTGLSGMAKSVKRFERANGLDTELYKNYLYLYFFVFFFIVLAHGGWSIRLGQRIDGNDGDDYKVETYN